ncbi:MAG: N-acetylglucosamine-6-phosphate deacetylase [Acidobacteriaceae bacterium]|nr:N-acetylglucosamine-6-phosphate deacetylase [Acidobacteriaceae bacterium]
MQIALTAATALSPLKSIPHAVVVFDTDDGTIIKIGPRDAVEIPTAAKHIDFGDAILVPGFIDIHIHGGAGHDVMEGDASALAAVESSIARHGVTSYCPTTVTAPLDKTLASLEKLGRAVKENGRDRTVRARPVGLHLEGPFISSAKCGVHPVQDIAAPSLELFERFWAASQGTIRVMTIAPELPNAAELIREATTRGVRASLGHSNAESAPTKSAIDAGARHATHTFNAMRSLNHRDPGILGVVLSDERLSADIIVDGIHVAPEIVKIFLAAKTEERAVLITDAISATGMPDGRYRLGTFEVEVKGATCLLDGHLAGSVLTMDAAVRNVMAFAQWDLQRSVRLATLNPARLLGIDDRKGSLEDGKDADIVVLSASGQVIRTIVGGVGT